MDHYLSKMKGMAALSLVATAILVFTAPVEATYPVGPWTSPAYATYYGETNGYDGNMGGACGYGDANGFISPQLFGVYTAALSDVLFLDGVQCGACFELQCVTDGSDMSRFCLPQTQSVIVMATNNCPLGSSDGYCDAPKRHFYLSVPAYTTIAAQVGGVVPIQYRRVRCLKQGGIRFLIKGIYFYQLALIYNVAGAGDIQSVMIKGDNTAWFPTRRDWGENWRFRVSQGQGLSFSVTTSDNANVISNDVADANWAYGMTFEGEPKQSPKGQLDWGPVETHHTVTKGNDNNTIRSRGVHQPSPRRRRDRVTSPKKLPRSTTHSSLSGSKVS